MAYEIEYNGQVYEVDDSSLDKYYNPETGQLEVDVLAQDLQSDLKGMDEETAASFEQTNKDLKQLDYALNRGENFGGAARNFAMGVLPGTAEAEAALRATKQYIKNIDPTASKASKTDTTWSEDYDKYLQNARESREEFARKNPVEALGLQIGGGLASALVPFSKVAKATNWGQAVGRSLLPGVGMGATYGFGNAQGGLENRLDAAALGALYGLGGAVAGPTLSLGTGATRNALLRIGRGLGKAPTEREIGNFIVDDIITGAGKPGAQSQRNASVLLQAVQDNDTAIQDAARNLQNKMLAMGKQRKPEIVELALDPNWTPETPSAQKIIGALTTPSKKAAGEKFGTFVSQQPEKTGAGLALNNFFKKNPVAKKIVTANKRRIGEDLTTYDGLQKIEETLEKNLPKSLDTQRAVNRNAQILDAKEDLGKLRETLFPGQTKMDAMYRASVGGVQDTAENTAKAYLQQIVAGVPNPTNAEVSLTGAAKIGLKPYVRGRARELIKTGNIRDSVTPTGFRVGSTATDAIIRSLLNLR